MKAIVCIGRVARGWVEHRRCRIQNRLDLRAHTAGQRQLDLCERKMCRAKDDSVFIDNSQVTTIEGGTILQEEDVLVGSRSGHGQQVWYAPDIDSSDASRS